MSKPVLAYAVMKMCERGVKLDQPLSTYARSCNAGRAWTRTLR